MGIWVYNEKVDKQEPMFLFQEAYFLKFIECDQLAKGKTVKFENYLIVGTKEIKKIKRKKKKNNL